MNWDRAVLGVAAVFGVPSRNSGTRFRAAHFRRFLRFAEDTDLTVPMLVNHAPHVGRRGYVGPVGEVTDFAVVEDMSLPDCLLVAGSLHDLDGFADEMVAELAKQTDPNRYWSGRSWGLSMGWSPFDELSDTVHLEDVVPCEVSLVTRPAVDGCTVLAVGDKVPDVWQLLTGQVLTGVHDGP